MDDEEVAEAQAVQLTHKILRLRLRMTIKHKILRLKPQNDKIIHKILQLTLQNDNIVKNSKKLTSLHINMELQQWIV